MNRVFVAVDVSNVYYTAKDTFNRNVDYEFLLKTALRGRELYRAVAYSSVDSQAFITKLQCLNFEVKSKTPKVYAQPDGSVNRKADCDVDITIDVVRSLARFDTLVLVSADGDLAPLVEFVRDSGATVEVHGIKISRDLRDAANCWREIDASYLLGESNDPAKVPAPLLPSNVNSNAA